MFEKKPSVVRPVVANFGRATTTEIESSRCGGSNGYCAPEVLDSRLEAQGFASDVFSNLGRNKKTTCKINDFETKRMKSP